MTTLTERVPLDRIEHRARHARPGRVLLTLLAAVLFALGWTGMQGVRAGLAGGGVVRFGGR